MNKARFVLAVLALIFVMPVAAQKWPAKSVAIVVTHPPGGGADAVARFVAEQLQERTGQQFLVENRPGASSMVGTQFVARAVPDGYTVLVATVSAAMNAHLFKTVPYDHIKDFTPVTTLATAPFMLLVNPEVVPVKSAAELTKFISARAGGMAYGGAGSGGIVAAQLYFSLSGIDRERVTLIPYKGGPDTVHDLLGGRIHFTFFEATFGTQQARAGKLRALAVTSTERNSASPHIPTMAESGFPSFDLVGWYAMFLPANAPRQIAQQLAELVNASMTTEKGREFLKKFAMDPKPSSPENFAQFLKDETAKWGRLIRDAGIKPQ